MERPFVRLGRLSEEMVDPARFWQNAALKNLVIVSIKANEAEIVTINVNHYLEPTC